MEQELNLIKTQEGYEAEFIANTDFAFHFESLDMPLSILVYSKSVEDGEYDLLRTINSTGNIYDRDQPPMNYPKYIKIVSTNPLKKASIVKSSGKATVSFEVDEDGNLIVNS